MGDSDRITTETELRALYGEPESFPRLPNPIGSMLCAGDLSVNRPSFALVAPMRRLSEC